MEPDETEFKQLIAWLETLIASESRHRGHDPADTGTCDRERIIRSPAAGSDTVTSADETAAKVEQHLKTMVALFDEIEELCSMIALLQLEIHRGRVAREELPERVLN
jgi:hypothetical protein